MLLKYSIVAGLLVCLAFPALGQGRPPLTDHALISSYEGSVMRRKDVREFDEYSAFTGMDDSGKEPTSLALEGKVTKMIYKAPENRSTLEVFRNYESAMAQFGAEVLYSCNQDKLECVARYAGPTLQKVSDIHSISNLEGRYLLAKVEQDDYTAYIAIAVGRASNTIHVVEVKKMDLGMVSLDAAVLGKGLDARGYVIVEGIYFDTDKATLQTQSSVALEEMAKLLASRPDLNVYIVGHTDSQGSFAHNQALSLDRAAAVVDALAADHGINRARMEGHGVGPLAPQGNNNNDSGRAKNRRVVMVVR
jgi:outer membrane protein OmpA-like peptidoglycan-associated protein